MTLMEFSGGCFVLAATIWAVLVVVFARWG
jgi:hypothetical protein